MLKYYPKVDFARNNSVAVYRFDDTHDFSKYRENAEVMRTLSVFWVSLLGDSPIDLNKPMSLIHRFAKNIVNRGTGLIRSFASLYDSLIRSLERSDTGTLIIKSFIIEFKDTPIFREYLEFYKTRSPIILKYISTFLLFGKKVYYQDDTFHANAFRDWCETEKRLDGVSFDQNVILDLREIISWMLRHFDDTLVLPRHGSGAVAERGARTFSEKNKLLYESNEIVSAFARPFTIGSTVPYTSESLPSGIRCNSSRLIFVPKDITKSRSICAEPAMFQWMQQTVRLWIEKCIDDLKHHIPLHDQSINQRRAMYGSISGKFDTIDLSQASDSVHIDLVKGIFPAHVLRYLLLSRTERTEIEPDIDVGLTKFAPMGSGLCFPIQSIIYSAVVLRSSIASRLGITADGRVVSSRRLMYHYYKLIYEDGGRHRLVPFSIYGDDIICDSRITHHVIETLNSLGFIVNDDKSFTGNSAFRESCGGYYYNGTDVTPLRAKLGEIKNTIPISTLSSIIDLGNRAFEYGYYTLYRTCIQFALHYPITGVRYRADQTKNEILFSSDRDVPLAFYYSNVRNTHLRERLFNEAAPHRSTCYRYQRDEVKSLTIRPTRYSIASSGDDDYAYCAWWRSRLAGPTDSEFSRKIPTHVGPTWRWTAK